MGVETIEVGGHKVYLSNQKKSEKVRVFLTPEELMLLDVAMNKLKFSQRPPVFRYLLKNFDNIEKAIDIVNKYKALKDSKKEFDNVIP
jgi:hypothetical protein